MKRAFITGVSKGLGRALALHFLENQWQVHGYGRVHTIEHPLYTPVNVDFSEALPDFPIAIDASITEAVWINNAGVLGEIGPLGSLNDAEMVQGLHVNLSAALLCTNRLLRAWGGRSQPLTILNISSGAARNAYASWAMYCASKAGMDRFSEALALELNERQQRAIRVFSVAPGVLDTPMQQHIRASSVEQFSQVERFKSMHENGQLVPPAQVAHELYTLVQQREAVSEVLVDLRNLKR